MLSSARKSPLLLAPTGLTAERKPAAGYAPRILVLIRSASCRVYVRGMMLIGRLVAHGADAAAATVLLTHVVRDR